MVSDGARGSLFVDVSDGWLAVRIYQLLTSGFGIAQISLATLFIFLPRSWFQYEFLRDAYQVGTTWWPKLAFDYSALSRLNSSFADKFVAFSLVSVLTCLMFTAILLPILVVALAKAGQSLDCTFHNSPKPLLVLIIFFASVVFVFVWPTPFQRLTSSEPVLVYSAIFWIALQVFFVNSIAMLSKFIFGRRAR